MAIPPVLQLGLGAILAAAIAGGFSILGLIIAKEQKISDFRRDWVEELRADIARFLANASLIYAMMERSPPDVSVAEAMTVFREQLVAMFEASSRIRLKMDDTDPVTAPILETLRRFEGWVHDGAPPPVASRAALERLLFEQSRVLMRREWHRVRRGEAVYRTAKAVAMAATGVAVAALLAVGAVSISWRG